mmetsp:Transcript_25250/g.43608  ORF Transcript_25250/g.43608 Transcript_25250/m.43608 type:complete len:98 (+) Transcript_25250:248-541(+)
MLLLLPSLVYFLSPLLSPLRLSPTFSSAPFLLPLSVSLLSSSLSLTRPPSICSPASPLRPFFFLRHPFILLLSLLLLAMLYLVFPPCPQLVRVPSLA